MKLITAIIQPHRLQDVEDALFKINVTTMTVSQVLGSGRQGGYDESYQGIVHEVNLRKKIRLEIAVNEPHVAATIAAIIRGARTGHIGDGKIFVTEIAEVIRIRTGEKGKAAVV